MIKGERFEVDLGSDSEDDAITRPPPGSFVTDVLERQPTAAKPPSAPTFKNKTGFPEHKKRDLQSRSKHRRQGQSTPDEKPAEHPIPTRDNEPAKPKSWVEEEKQRIDEENRQRLADMTPAQVEEERRELLSSLSPAMIERLLQRSNISSGSNEADLSSQPEQPIPSVLKPKKLASKSVTFAEQEEQPDGTTDDRAPSPADEADAEVPEGELLPHDSVHFPRPQQPPDLDPASSTFLEDLHEKYFPSLPADPDKLEWMQSSRVDNKAYNPSATAFDAKDIRFSFTGELIAPKTASLIPVTAGLHHHGDAPDSAGYTIAELAHLSRSTYAAQRCIAFQTLGRFLYRLGKGEFGDPGEPGADVTGVDDSFGELARGLWHEVEQQKVIETLVMESEGMGADRGKHMSAKAYATEAVHLWRKGGGRRWKAS